MLDHLQQCFEMRISEMFPKKMIGSKRLHMQQQESQLIAYNLYCFCWYPEAYDKQMVECESCGEWFHFSCLGLKSIRIKLKANSVVM